MAPPHIDIRKRFESKIEKNPVTGCWIWKGCGSHQSYGKFRIGGRKGRMWYAHRAAWLIYHKEDPAERSVCHSCDVKHCVNPEHLFLGSQKDNMRDASAKGLLKQPQGQDSVNAKLTNRQVREMRKKHKDKEIPLRLLAKEYEISKSQAWNIISGSQWKEV